MIVKINQYVISISEKTPLIMISINNGTTDIKIDRF